MEDNPAACLYSVINGPFCDRPLSLSQGDNCQLLLGNFFFLGKIEKIDQGVSALGKNENEGSFVVRVPKNLLHGRRLAGRVFGSQCFLDVVVHGLLRELRPEKSDKQQQLELGESIFSLVGSRELLKVGLAGRNPVFPCLLVFGSRFRKFFKHRRSRNHLADFFPLLLRQV